MSASYQGQKFTVLGPYDRVDNGHHAALQIRRGVNRPAKKAHVVVPREQLESAYSRLTAWNLKLKQFVSLFNLK